MKRREMASQFGGLADLSSKLFICDAHERGQGQDQQGYLTLRTDSVPGDNGAANALPPLTVKTKEIDVNEE